jgi:uncharacterized membrane protein YraQ (UPF0718 family)
MYSHSITEYVILIFYTAGKSLLGLAPYIIFGVVVGELLKLTSWTKLIYKGVNRSPIAAVLIASILGMVSPLCTYGTVPVVLQLFKAKVPISPLITFLSVSAMMNPQLFIYTWGGLGPEIALARAASVLLFGLLLGLFLYRVPQSWIVNASAVTEETSGQEILNREKKQFHFKKFISGVADCMIYVGFYIVIGVVISSVIDVLVPKSWLSALFQGNGFLSLLISALLGVPLYACGGGIIPVVQGFLANGMSKGEALAFLFVGPATRITPLMALAVILKPLVIVLYVILVILYSLLIGTIYH